jgi:hypothetical protein
MAQSYEIEEPAFSSSACTWFSSSWCCSLDTSDTSLKTLSDILSNHLLVLLDGALCLRKSVLGQQLQE